MLYVTTYHSTKNTTIDYGPSNTSIPSQTVVTHVKHVLSLTNWRLVGIMNCDKRLNPRHRP